MWWPNIDEKTLIYKTRKSIKCICTQCVFNVISTGTKKHLNYKLCHSVCKCTGFFSLSQIKIRAWKVKVKWHKLNVQKCTDNCNHSPSLLKKHMIILRLVLPALPVAPPSIQSHYSLWADAFKVLEPSLPNKSIFSLLPHVRNLTSLTLLQCPRSQSQN